VCLLLDIPASFMLNSTQLCADFGEQVKPAHNGRVFAIHSAFPRYCKT